MKNSLTSHLCFIFMIIQFSRSLSLEEYQQMEKQTPEVMFTERIDDPQIQRTPQLQKLMFITPWSKQGIDLSIKYAKKLDYISPCWYDLSFSSEHIIIQNDKLYDSQYLKNIRQANPQIKILPRFYIASNQQSLLHTIGSFQSKFKQAINLIVRIVEANNYQGIVFDTPFNTFMEGQRYAGLRNLIIQLVNSVKMNFRKQKLVFFNMANPLGLTLANDRYSILNVDCILLQNYDNDKYFQMIDAAINWSKSIKVQSKPSFMLLLPFFSRRKGQGIDTKQIQKLYDSQPEHMGSVADQDLCIFFQYQRRIQTYTPCYAYFKRVFETMKNSDIFKVGFWESGNGLELFYDFL